MALIDSESTGDTVTVAGGAYECEVAYCATDVAGPDYALEI